MSPIVRIEHGIFLTDANNFGAKVEPTAKHESCHTSAKQKDLQFVIDGTPRRRCARAMPVKIFIFVFVFVFLGS